jgi:precorrin-6B methylase 2
MMHESTGERLLQMVRGYWVSQMVGTLARLGIPDCLATAPIRCDDLAVKIGCDPDATRRLLRACASIGLVVELGGERFGNTDLGEMLRADAPGSMRDFALALTAPGHWLPWGGLADAVRSGKRQTPVMLGHELFEYYRQNPDEGRAFTGAMSNRSKGVASEIARVLDVSTAKHIVDVGGASGTIIASILEGNPGARGTIVELPHVAPQARTAIAARGLASRCAVVEGDFFRSVPEADIYLLKWIIHDWDDEQSIQILTNCARSLRANGRVILVECVLPENMGPSQGWLADINMLVVMEGRERSASQYARLLEAAGLQLVRIIDTNSPMQLIEAVHAPSGS